MRFKKGKTQLRESSFIWLSKNRVALPPLQKLFCTRLNSEKCSNPSALAYTQIIPKK